MTRRLIPISAGFLAGLFAAFQLCVNGGFGLNGFLYLIAAAALLGFLSIIFHVRFRARVLVFCCAFAVACAYSAASTALKLLPLEALDGETVEIVGKVVDYTESDRSAVTVSGRVNGIRTKVLVYISGFSGDLGDEVRLFARVSKLGDSPFFRSREYYLPDGVLLTASAAGGFEVTPSSRSLFDLLRGYSTRVSLEIRKNVGGESGELLAAMVTGDRTAFSDGLRLKLNRAGVGHLAAVSGLQVSIVALAVMLFMRKLRASRLFSAAVTEACVAAFIVFSGLRVSAIRAGIMMTVAILSTIAKRRSDPLNTICLCGLLMTVWNPYSAADSSLVLSLSGVFGVAVMSPAVARAFSLRLKIVKSLAASLCACAATAPFIMLYFNELSIVSPLTNLFAIPVCALALMLGMVYALTGCAVPGIARFAGFLVGTVIRASGAVSQHRFTYIPLGSNILVFSAAFAAATVIAIYLLTHRSRFTAFCAVLCAAAVICVYGAQSIITQNNIYLTALSRNSDHALVLRKGAECIIIDFDGGMAGGVETVIERSGIAKVRAVLLFDNAEAAYSAYAEMPIAPDIVYLPENAYVFGGKVATENLPDGSSIGIFGAELTLKDGGVSIYLSDSVTTVAQDGSGTINMLNGITVLNENGEIRVFKGDIIKEIKLGVADNGGQANI